MLRYIVEVEKCGKVIHCDLRGDEVRKEAEETALRITGGERVLSSREVGWCEDVKFPPSTAAIYF